MLSLSKIQLRSKSVGHVPNQNTSDTEGTISQKRLTICVPPGQGLSQSREPKS